MADHTKKAHRFHPVAMRIVCIEVLVLLLCTVILSLISISMYKSSFLSSIAYSDRVLATDITMFYEQDADTEAVSTDWLQESDYLQTIFDWTSEETNSLYFLFDTNGDCVLCSSDVTGDRNEIHLDATVIKQLVEDGTYSSDTLAAMVPGENRPVISNGTIVSLSSSGGEGSVYYLFSDTATDLIESFMIRTWVFSLLTCAVLSAILGMVTVIYLNQQQKPLERMMQVAQQCVQGDYTEHIVPGSFEEPFYEELAYSINELAYAAENAEEQRKQFVSNVSHELRTPMTIISGYVDGILDGTVPKAKRMQYLSIVSQEMQRLKILISSMLNLTKFDNGTIQIHYQKFPIQDMVFRTILMFESRMEKRQINLEGLDSEPMQVWGDPDLLGQVIYNLFENAVKFVDTGGTITFTFSENATESAIAIRNTGAGISKEELPKIFERFYKSDDSRSHDKTGLGIGLDITKHIIRLHKAQISVSSEEGSYTEFLIRLPKEGCTIAGKEAPAKKPEKTS
jgi:signal transduction histidine kinase